MQLKILIITLIFFQSCQNGSQQGNSFRVEKPLLTKEIANDQEVKSKTEISLDTIKEEDTSLEIGEVYTKVNFKKIEKEVFQKYYSIKQESVDTVETRLTRTDTSFLIQVEDEHIFFKANPKDVSEISTYIGWLRAIDFHIISTNYSGGAHYSQSFLMNGVTGEKYSLDGSDSDFGFNRFEISPNNNFFFLGLDDLYTDDSFILIKKITQKEGIYHLDDYTNYSAEEDWMIQEMAWMDDSSFVLKVIYNGRTFNSDDDYEDTEENNKKGKVGFLKGTIE